MLVDDHTVLRDGLKSIIEMEEDIKVVGEAESGSEAIAKIGKYEPDVILMDINMPDKNGVEVTGILKNKQPGIKIIILTMFNHDEFFLAAIREGADGYLLKDTPSIRVVEAIRSVYKGETVLHPSMTKKLLSMQQHKNEKKSNELTERETEVLKCLVEGLSNKEIANRLFISDKTVKIHVSNIYKKLNVKSRSQVIIYAVQNQLIPLPSDL